MIEWSMKFQVVQPLKVFPRPLCIEKETHNNTNYHIHGPSNRGETYCFMQYTLSGEGIYKDKSGTYHLPKGKMILGDVTNDYEYFYPSGAKTPWTFFWFGFIGDMIKPAVQELVNRFGPVYDLPEDTGIIPALLQYKNYNGLIYELTPHDGTCLVTELLSDIIASQWSQHPQDTKSILVRKTQQFISENLDTPLRISQIAEDLYVSREHLSRIFKEHTGFTLQNYILRQKMSLACKLLKETHLSIKEISARLGYDHPPQFIRNFKQLLKLTPSQFRLTKTNIIL